MVFSEASLNTRSTLKVVELDRLKTKAEKEFRSSGSQATPGGNNGLPPSPVSLASTSFSETFLKPGPIQDSKMFCNPDSEFFQELDLLCFEQGKEGQAQTDLFKKIEEDAHNTDTPHTPFSPHGWETFDINSPAQTDFYTTTPNVTPSPKVDYTHKGDKFLFSPEIEKKDQLLDMFDIRSLPVVLGDLASEETIDLCPSTETVDFNTTQSLNEIGYTNPVNTEKIFIDQEDTLDNKLVAVIPNEIHIDNDLVVSEYVINDTNGGVLEKQQNERYGAGLSLDVTQAQATPWFDDIISTPEVLSCVEQLEKEKYILPSVTTPEPWQQDTLMTEDSCQQTTCLPVAEYEPITPKSESHVDSDEEYKPQSNKRRRRNSEDSDYTPYVETVPRKYKRKKSNIPLKEMILALEGSQQLPKARRGRPPKRRDSTVSSIGSVDDSASTTSTHEGKYRELRDKNNEASKRSRMNRKLKELQMEQLALELEERNKKLKVRADILEDMTKRLKDALMTAILQK